MEGPSLLGCNTVTGKKGGWEGVVGNSDPPSQATARQDAELVRKPETEGLPGSGSCEHGKWRMEDGRASVRGGVDCQGMSGVVSGVDLHERPEFIVLSGVSGVLGGWPRRRNYNRALVVGQAFHQMPRD